VGRVSKLQGLVHDAFSVIGLEGNALGLVCHLLPSKVVLNNVPNVVAGHRDQYVVLVWRVSDEVTSEPKI